MKQSERMNTDNIDPNISSAKKKNNSAMSDEKKRQRDEARRLARKLQSEEKKRQKDEEKRLENLWIEDFERRNEEIKLIRKELANLKRIRDERVRDLDREIETLEEKCEELSNSTLKCPHRRTTRKSVQGYKIQYKYYDLITCTLCGESWNDYEFVPM